MLTWQYAKPGGYKCYPRMATSENAVITKVEIVERKMRCHTKQILILIREYVAVHRALPSPHIAVSLVLVTSKANVCLFVCLVNCFDVASAACSLFCAILVRGTLTIRVRYPNKRGPFKGGDVFKE